MKPRASMWAKGHGTGVDYNIEVQFGTVTFIFPAEGKTHAIDIVAAINREEPLDEYGQPYTEKSPAQPNPTGGDGGQ